MQRAACRTARQLQSVRFGSGLVAIGVLWAASLARLAYPERIYALYVNAQARCDITTFHSANRALSNRRCAVSPARRNMRSIGGCGLPPHEARTDRTTIRPRR